MTARTFDITAQSSEQVTVWKCPICHKGEAEGARRMERCRGGGRKYRTLRCTECYREGENARQRQMRATKRAAAQIIAAHQHEIGRSGFSVARPLPLAWEINALNDEADAATIERRDPDQAARLRDRAQNWRGLIAEMGGVRA